MYDITVRADDIVFLLDSRDAEWLWVQLPNGKQGYVPNNYLATIGKYHFGELHSSHTHLLTWTEVWSSLQTKARGHLTSFQT